MMNVSLKLSFLVFILVIMSNLGSEARELAGVNEIFEIAARSSNNAGTARALQQAPPCKRDVDCSFECPKGGFCNDRLGTCDCF
ncbi:putative defensin-like protein 257 [Arabidopsis thaliana]|uniref:Putative defensin-like protein 257 n=2 Tax=Arabidopsis TaxID=3701 RepID=DF257_ARATH|nr:Defensin-like (DEFL) family protein [Arabidopsis thaliana]Q2V3S8.1 RecName: Full=Putative defensin-like protein 257; Flags: Precursor [Arabidopsis thaliana]AEE76909.1 Defensin-like (DEFL) family protein [Arabidopsis thaliana]|eukprot:NP_001030759.1 Defensin-like (DEFL) family protein [Arabidopsis thaliana]